MYAVIETGGKQYRVEPGETIRVESLAAEPGQDLVFKALWAVKDGEPSGAAPSSQQAQVTAEVARRLRGPKILVFRKKSKKAYKKMRGHRQELTALKIKTISFN